MAERDCAMSYKNFHVLPLAFMGVRSYTPDMTALPSSTIGPSPAVIDWSEMLRGSDTTPDVEKLIAWVGTFPRISGLRVYLPSVAHRASMSRLQRTLQSMGCTVTCRLASPVRS
jgi:hypothetical protein